MVAITADEKKIIAKECPHIHIVRTMKQRSKRHHYYMEEAPAAMRILRELRGEAQPKPRDRKNNRKGRRRFDH